MIRAVGAASSWQAHMWCAFSAGTLQAIVGFVSIGGLVKAWQWRDAFAESGPMPTSDIAHWMRKQKRARVARFLLLALCGVLAMMLCLQVATYVAVGAIKCGDELPRTARVLLTIWSAGAVVACILALSSRLVGGSTRRTT